MIRKTFIIFGFLFIILVLFVTYLSLIGINTNKFNSFIKKEVKAYNNELDVNLNKVRLILDVKEFNINIFTSEPTIIYRNKLL